MALPVARLSADKPADKSIDVAASPSVGNGPMKPPRLRRAILVSVLMLSPALTTACGMGRDGAADDQIALQKALSSVAAPKGVKAETGASMECGLNIDCGDISSHITYRQDLGHLKACAAAIELAGKVPAEGGHWSWTGGVVPPAGWPATPAEVMIATCVEDLSIDPKPANSPGQVFTMRSDLKPGAVPVKSAKAELTVEDPFDDTTAVKITLKYDGPSTS